VVAHRRVAQRRERDAHAHGGDEGIGARAPARRSAHDTRASSARAAAPAERRARVKRARRPRRARARTTARANDTDDAKTW